LGTSVLTFDISQIKLRILNLRPNSDSNFIAGSLKSIVFVTSHVWES